MSQKVFTLDPLVVIGRTTSKRPQFLEGFYRRLASGSGTYFTPEDIQRRIGDRLPNLIGDIPGIHIQQSGPGGRATATIRGKVHLDPNNPACEPLFFVDGHEQGIGRALGGNMIDLNSVSMAEIAAVEVYKGVSTIPAEFLAAGSDCGVIVVWTKHAFSDGQ
jgi:outer membrane receptor for ferrienterochelin and colicin